MANCKVIQLHSGNLGIQGFWMCDIRCGSYRQKHIGLGYSAPCRWIYVVFCVWDICRSLDQPSKLHHPPLHGLACSTTFSWRKIKVLLVLGNAFPQPLGLGPLITHPSGGHMRFTWVTWTLTGHGLKVGWCWAPHGHPGRIYMGERWPSQLASTYGNKMGLVLILN